MKIMIILIVSTLVGCSFKPCCDKFEDRKAILEGYRIAKHSHMYIRLVGEPNIIDIDGLGGRRKPTIKLGDTLSVNVCVSSECGGYVTMPEKYHTYSGESTETIMR